MGYCDVHCHILPGLDDGAKSMEQAMEMISISVDNGISDIILTPHYKIDRCEHSKEKILERIQELEINVKQKNSDVKLYAGTELMYSEDCISLLEQEKILTLNGTKVLLVEFHPSDNIKYIKESLYKIICAGYNPLLAHIERYENLVGEYDDIEDVIEQGTYIQVNASSVIGKHGMKIKKFIKMLMKYDMLHFIGTDAHNTSDRAPHIGECAKYIEKKFGKEYRDELLINNPAKYLNITK